MKRKHATDLLWNYASLACMAVSGLTINSIIIWAYGTAEMGVFNLAYAIYILFGQFAAGGIQLALLSLLSSQKRNDQEIQTIISSGLPTSITYGVICAALLFLLKGNISAWLSKPTLSISLSWVAFALVFFSLNKSMIGIFNGLKSMEMVAIGFGSRYLSIMIVIIIMASMHLSAQHLPACFLIGEILTSLLLLAKINTQWLRWRITFQKKWALQLTSFGYRSFLSGAFVELNTRVDVIILGLFASATAVGVYSFAAMIAEGLTFFLIIIQRQCNPYISQHLVQNKNPLALHHMIKKARKFLYIGMAIIIGLALIVYPEVVSLIYPHSGLEKGLLLLAILSAGIFLAAGYLPFNQILLMSGFPVWQTLYAASIIGSNIILNFLLAPHFGMYGTAIATAIANSAALIIGLKFLAYRKLKFKI